jgi:hypothetical protein
VYVAGWDDMTPVEIICLMGVVASCHRVCLSTALASCRLLHQVEPVEEAGEYKLLPLEKKNPTLASILFPLAILAFALDEKNHLKIESQGPSTRRTTSAKES